jgi:hypothetical protein
MATPSLYKLCKAAFWLRLCKAVFWLKTLYKAAFITASIAAFITAFTAAFIVASVVVIYLFISCYGLGLPEVTTNYSSYRYF